MFVNKKYRKLKIVLSIIGLLLMLAVGVTMYYIKFFKEDLNQHLPITDTVAADEKDLETIAYHFWMDFMSSFQGRDVSSWQRLSDVRFNKFQLLAGDENEFAVAVTFWVKLEKENWSTHHNWGELQKDGTINDIQWTLRIKKTGENVYTLERIEETSNAVAGLEPVKDQYQKEAGIMVPDMKNRYRLENDKPEVTYDNGKHWRTVPVLIEDLFKGEFNGSKQELIEGSYRITPEMTSFVVVEEKVASQIEEGTYLTVLYSDDKGKTWNRSTFPSPIPVVRLRLLGFTSEQNGYLILTGDRTMSFEANTSFKTSDGGKTWVNTGSVQGTNRLLTSGGFINDTIGFMSFGSITMNDQPERPSLYRTTDGGVNWVEVEVPIPAEYKGIFTLAEVPAFDGSQGVLLVNQGPNGDYLGGKVLARFTSVDYGATWYFANLVDPDNVIDQ